MASEQFILEMYIKLHPDRAAHEVKDLTPGELAEITKIIDDKHSVGLSSKWIPDNVTVDLRVLRNVLVSATNHCHTGLRELNAKTVGDMGDGAGRIDPYKMTVWEKEVAYYQNQLDAINLIEELLETLRMATNKEGFYMQGVVVT
ncbi:hypothetical protein KAR91_85175 [Candidatus Pacearchaeota archaeon]|nr:hypothetical protein [Candidatus Pacearchaeota archaeon]